MASVSGSGTLVEAHNYYFANESCKEKSPKRFAGTKPIASVLDPDVDLIWVKTLSKKEKVKNFML